MVEWLERLTAKHEISDSNPGILPFLKYTFGESDWLLCWKYTMTDPGLPRG